MATTSPLRQRMIEDMTIRNLSQASQQSYIYSSVRALSKTFRRLFIAGLQAAFARGELGFFGDLAPLADDPENLFDALTILMNDEEKRYHLACEGNVRARRLFDLRRVASDLDDFCAQAMQEAGCE